MNVLLLTYDAPHRKTQDVAYRLLSAGHTFSVLATPWVDRRPRRMLYAHRPAELTWPCDAIGDHIHFFRNLGIRYTVVPESGSLFDLAVRATPDAIVIGGAGILDKRIVETFRVLNVHPGRLPAARGLDILKWSILELQKVGATAHLCDDETDLGWRVLEMLVPVFRNDTFHSFAMRQYEIELGMIPLALKALEGRPRDYFEKIDREDTVARRRMGRRVESGLLPAFERFKLMYAQ